MAKVQKHLSEGEWRDCGAEPGNCPIKGEDGQRVEHMTADNEHEMTQKIEADLAERHGTFGTVSKADAAPAANRVNTNPDIVQYPEFDADAGAIQPGDRLRLDVFDDSDDMVLEDSAEVVKAEEIYHPDGQRSIMHIEFADGKKSYKDVFAPVRVVRSTDAEYAPKTENDKTPESTTHRKELTASGIKAGDVVHGEKFTESGKWVDDNSARVTEVNETINTASHKRQVDVTYEDGTTATFGASAPVTVLREGVAPQEYTIEEVQSTIDAGTKKIMGTNIYGGASGKLKDESFNDDDARNIATALESDHADARHAALTNRMAGSLRAAGREDQAQTLYDAVNKYNGN